MTTSYPMRTLLCAVLAALIHLSTSAVAKEIPAQLPDPSLTPAGMPTGAAKCKVGYPHFSWDRVPLYAHIGLGDGLKPEQYKFLADHYDFIAFTGGRMSREYRTKKEITFERIVAHAARTIKTRNPKAQHYPHLGTQRSPAGPAAGATSADECFLEISLDTQNGLG